MGLTSKRHRFNILHLRQAETHSAARAGLGGHVLGPRDKPSRGAVKRHQSRSSKPTGFQWSGRRWPLIRWKTFSQLWKTPGKPRRSRTH